MQRSSITFTIRVAIIAAVALCAFAVSAQATIIDYNGTTLRKFVTDSVRKRITGNGSNKYKTPTATEANRWESLIGLLTAKNWNGADNYIQSYFPSYQLLRYRESGSTLCYVLYEKDTSSVNFKGWGSYYFNPNLIGTRPICVEVPHPFDDLYTEYEGPEMFEATDARFMMIAGTRRNSRTTDSPCDHPANSPYKISDVAHSTETPYHIAHRVIIGDHPSVYTIALHGNADADCKNYYITNGRDTTPSQFLKDLKTSIVSHGASSPGVCLYGDCNCDLNGTQDAQGRHINGVSDQCGTYATGNGSNYFIHIEQSGAVRGVSQGQGQQNQTYGQLIEAIKDRIPAFYFRIIIFFKEASDNASPGATTHLGRSFPNPMRDRSTITFTIAENGPVRLAIHDATGRTISTLIDEVMAPGEYETRFDMNSLAEPLPSGVYYCRLTAGNVSEVQEIVVVR